MSDSSSATSEATLESLLKDYTIHETKKLKKTQQGFICFGRRKCDKKPIILKTALKVLVERRQTINCRMTNENFHREVENMKYVTRHLPNKLGFVKFIDFVSNGDKYCLLQEYGGEMTLIEYLNKINIPSREKYEEYSKEMRDIFAMLVETVHDFHNECSLCHLDLSLENTVIVHRYLEPLIHGCVKIIDFGASYRFVWSKDSKEEEDTNKEEEDNNKKDNKNKDKKYQRFQHNHFVGHLYTIAPEVFACKKNTFYDARKADVYSLGMILLALLFRSNNFYQFPNAQKDDNFKELMECGIQNFLIAHNQDITLVSNSKLAMDLLSRMVCYENNRFLIHDVFLHEYVRESRYGKKFFH